jgi:hypothetical protein
MFMISGFVNISLDGLSDYTILGKAFFFFRKFSLSSLRADVKKDIERGFLSFGFFDDFFLITPSLLFFLYVTIID